MIKVKEVMTHQPEAIDFTASIREAVRKMRDRRCRHLPVKNGKVVAGMISDRELRGYVLPFDVLEADTEIIYSRLEEPVSQLTQCDLISIAPDDDIKEAITLMLEHDIGALPVIDPTEGALLGMISYVDILRTCYERLL